MNVVDALGNVADPRLFVLHGGSYQMNAEPVPALVLHQQFEIPIRRICIVYAHTTALVRGRAQGGIFVLSLRITGIFHERRIGQRNLSYFRDQVKSSAGRSCGDNQVIGEQETLSHHLPFTLERGQAGSNPPLARRYLHEAS